MSVALQEREALLQGLLSYMGGAEMWGRDRKWAGDFLETRNKALRDQKEKKRRENCHFENTMPVNTAGPGGSVIEMVSKALLG